MHWVSGDPGVERDPERGPESAYGDGFFLRTVQGERYKPCVEGRRIEVAEGYRGEVSPW